MGDVDSRMIGNRAIDMREGYGHMIFSMYIGFIFDVASLPHLCSFEITS
jgi:hypothetical protein